MSLEAPFPLPPGDADLRGMPYMPLDSVRLFDSEFYLTSTGDEFKAGLTLWAKAFFQMPAGSLPNNDALLAQMSGAGSKWKRVKAKALHGWTLLADGRLYHRTVAEKVMEAWKARLAQRARTEAARAAKEAKKTKDPVKDDVTDVVTEAVTEPVTEVVTGSKGREGKGREDLSSGSKPDYEPLDRVLAELGWSIDDPKVHHAPSHIRRWLDAGYDLERHILPVLREVVAKSKGRQIGHLRYFDAAIAERFAEPPMTPAGRAAALAPDPRAPASDTKARARLEAWAKGQWPRDQWGPTPDEPGCLIPAHILAERKAA